MNQPLVSIIVPVYNSAAHLGRCLESIRKQKYDNLQIIFVNDGSKDSSLEIINMFARVDDRIVAVDKENGGVSAARNAALRIAEGEYIQFVDSDDFVDENYTRLMVEKAQETGADLVISHYCHVMNDKVTVHGYIEEQDAMHKSAFAVSLMEEPASFYYGVMWNKLYRASIIREHDIQCNLEMNWSEDFLFNLEYIRFAESFVSLHTPVYYYVYNEKSLVHTDLNPKKIVAGKLNLYQYYKQLYEDLGLYEENKLQVLKYLISFSEHR